MSQQKACRNTKWLASDDSRQKGLGTWYYLQSHRSHNLLPIASSYCLQIALSMSGSICGFTHQGDHRPCGPVTLWKPQDSPQGKSPIQTLAASEPGTEGFESHLPYCVTRCVSALLCAEPSPLATWMNPTLKGMHR